MQRKFFKLVLSIFALFFLSNVSAQVRINYYGESTSRMGAPNVPDRVNQILGSNFYVNNEAINSTKISDILQGQKFQSNSTVYPGSIAVINTGINDAVQNTSAATFSSHLGSLLSIARTYAIKVIIVKPNRIYDYSTAGINANYRLAEFDYVIDSLAGSYGAMVVRNTVNYYPYVAIDMSDAYHPTQIGYENVAQAVASAIRQL